MKQLLLIIALAVPACAQFTDTTGNVSVAASTMFLRGITTGCSPSTFCPGAPILRQEVATFIVRAIYSAITGDPENFTYTTSPAYFTDVPSTNIYYKYVQKFRDLGLTSGCQPNVFCATGYVTDGEMAVFIARAWQIIQGQPAVGAPDCTPFGNHTTCAARNSFPNDTGSYASWAHDYAEWIYAATGFVSTSECYTYQSFCSNSNASRGQVAMDIIAGAYSGITNLQYPSMDKMNLTGPTDALLPWHVESGRGGDIPAPGTVDLLFTTPVYPTPLGTTISIGCEGPGSSSILNGGSPTFNQTIVYGVGGCQQIFVRIATIGGYKYDYKYYTPYAVGTTVVSGSVVDTTPGIITIPPHAKIGQVNIAAEHVSVGLSGGKTILIRRGDIDYTGDVPYRFSRDGEGWRYEYELVNTKGVRSVNLGIDPVANLADPAPYSERRSPTQKLPQADSESPNGWTPFLGTGWTAATESTGKGHFAMRSERKPGLMPLFVQGDVLGKPSKEVGTPVRATTEEERINDRQDAEVVVNAAHWLNNSTQRFVIGPAFNSDAGRGEILVQVKRWVEDFGFEAFRPLIGMEGDQALEALSKVKPSTQLEKDAVACLREVLR